MSAFGEHHDAAGLVAADASLLPRPLGINPQETIAALAGRSADFLSSERERYVL